jgi:hypothetical protein
MIRSILIAFVAAGSLAACATSETDIVNNPGEVTVGGIAPSKALSSVNSQQVAANPTIQDGGETTTSQPNPNDEGTIAVQGAQPSAVLSAVDPQKLVDGESPE